jgi:hypothetical protein
VKDYYPVALLGNCEPALYQSLTFLLAAYRYQAHRLDECPLPSHSFKVLLVVGPLSEQLYHTLYYQQHLPTLLWGVDTKPTPLPAHVHWLPKRAGGSALIERLDSLMKVTRFDAAILPDIISRDESHANP